MSCAEVKVLERGEHMVYEHFHPSKTKQKIVTDPAKPLQIGFLKPRVLESVYVPYSAADSSTSAVF